MYRISIIVPVYKVELYISRCIKSIIDQEGCGAKIECIIVDDFSPDNSMSIIYSIIETYHGTIDFIILKHEINKGLSAARNTGVKTAQGEYVFFLDSDDWLPKGSISLFINVLRVYPNIDMIVGDSILTSNEKGISFSISKPIIISNIELKKSLLNSKNVTCSAWNKLVKTNIVKKIKFHEGIIFEDKLWTYFLCNNIEQAIIIPEITYAYENRHPFSITNTSRTRQNASLYIKSTCIIGNSILDNPYKDLYPDCIFYFLSNLIVALDLKRKYNIKDETCLQLSKLRKKNVCYSYKKGRWFLSLFILLLTFPPTSYAFNISWIRRHYDFIEKIGKLVTYFLERIKFRSIKQIAILILALKYFLLLIIFYTI